MGSGIYNVIAEVFKSGWYSYSIQVENALGIFGEIKDSPFSFFAYPTDPSYRYSKATGSGVSQAIIGRKE